MEKLCKVGYLLWLHEFKITSSITPSLHRLLQHSVLFMEHFQSKGYSLGETSEQVQEATNYDSKRDYTEHSFRGDIIQSNLSVFKRSWCRSDAFVLSYVKK